MKKLALIWLIGAALIATITTILQIEPAATFIQMTAGSDGSFVIIIPLGVTFIICALPLFPVLLINNLIQNRKYQFPTDLNGKTGIVVKREKELTNAALMYEVYINGELRSKVGMGKSVFIDLLPGAYKLQIKLSKKIYSAEIEVLILPEKIVSYQTKNDLNKSLTTLVAKGEMLLLYQVPYAK